jgi:intracellular sulfur oxidation DsrE/DsrF family protein
MHRRNILWGAISAFGAAFAASRASAATEAAPSAKLKVVYHLNDLDKVSFVLGNIQNHLDGVGGPDHVTIALVVHGQALRAFHLASAKSRSFETRRSILQSRSRTRRLRQHHEVPECHAEGFAAGLHCRRAGRRGADRRAAIARLSLPATVSLRPSDLAD